MKDKKPCSCKVCKLLHSGVYPVAPSDIPDPSKMEPGDCQRLLVELWEALGNK